MSKVTIPQNYPRIAEKQKNAGFLDLDRLVPHKKKIQYQQLCGIIEKAIEYASHKSSREILEIPDEASDEETRKIYFKEGQRLFAYFKKYCGDPATTAYDCHGRHYRIVAAEQFHNRSLQKERMNSGWRYQRMAYQCAEISKRFLSVSDIGAIEADFNLQIKTVNYPSAPIINIYISVKNRTNTMGGQDWPKAIFALEEMAKSDKNRQGPYLCVFGIAMERGLRIIRGSSKTKKPYSINTEVWLSDFFWPFVSNYSYEEMMLAVCDVLIAQGEKAENRIIGVPPPKELVESFGYFCKEYGLLDGKGLFDNPKKLVSFFCHNIIAKKDSKSNV